MMTRLHSLLFACLLMLPGVALAYVWQNPAAERELPGLWRGFAAGTHTATASGFPYAECFEAASVEYDVPLPLLLAVARGESDFEPKAVSSAGALGVMQILWPGTARDLNITTKRQAFNPCVNIKAGANYLAQMRARYDGNLHAALIAYNRGPANVDALIKRGRLQAASWYSGYVWDHLGFVLGRLGEEDPGDYAGSQRMVFITFSMPFRAQDLVNHLRTASPHSRFDWFKRQTGRFAVTLHYENAAQRKAGETQLRRLGLWGS